MPLVLGYEEVRRALTVAEAVDAIESACREQAAGQAIASERVNQRLPNGWLRLMAAALPASGVMGYKAFYLTRRDADADPPAEVRYSFALIDMPSGELLALMDANYLTAVRTGATAAVASRYLAPEGASRFGVLGSGSEARSQVEALAAVHAVRHVRVFSRSEERRQAFARQMSERLGVEVEAVVGPEQVARDVDVLVVATNTGGSGPALLGEWLPRGMHVSSIGSTMPAQREIDPAVWTWAERIVVDTPRLLEESGDALAAARAGAVDQAKIVELAAVVAGNAAGRTSAEQTTLYKSVGTSIQDVAVAWKAYRRALALGLGQSVPDFQSPKPAEPS
jgi:ornithine cyclodeaminase/alanine dehydrogenase